MASSRTQAGRSAATRQALIDATLELLAERGWAGITSVAVCGRAGLTRGAFVHHFRGLPELFAAALEARYADLAEVAREHTPPTTVEALLAQAWEAVTATDFKVVIEAWLAAANDPGLRAAIGPVVERFAKLVHPEQRPALLADEEAQSFFLMAHETILGLALGRATSGGRPLGHEARVLAHLAQLAKEQDARLGRVAMETTR